MSLVIAFIGRQGAVMAGDTREIITRGDRGATGILENELYSGLLITDTDVLDRAEELGVALTIRDGKRKVTQRDGILVGEVSETEGNITRKRRLYVTTGEYALAEVSGSEVTVTRRGSASTFVVLGNQVTRQIAHSCIGENWRNGSIQDAIRIIILSMKRASDATASVSKMYTLVHTASSASLSEVIERDNNS